MQQIASDGVQLWRPDDLVFYFYSAETEPEDVCVAVDVSNNAILKMMEKGDE